jgi:hypothetical protein
MSNRQTGASALDLVRKRRALAPLVPLVDACFERGEALKQRGWYSFEPYWKFRESLCSPEEWRTYRKYLVESRKEALGEYRSDFVATLKAQGGDERSGLTACDRKHSGLQGTPGYRAALSPFEEEQTRLRRKEIELHATAVSQRSASEERSERVRIWSEVVRERAGPLGFGAPTARKSHPSSFRRDLGGGWDFVLGVDAPSLGSETADTVAKPPGMGPLPIGAHTTWMALMPVGKAGVQRGDTESIVVPQYFVPFDGAYGIFWDLEGLEINVRAHMAALEILWPEMELRLVEAITRLR